MKLKKFTQKDRYGNTTSYEFEGDTKPLDPTALMKAQMEQMGNIPEMMAPPPVGGEEFKMGNPASHPGEPRGDDTVPAWLTPGEFVVNAEAMSIPGNAEMVEQINNQGRAMQQGGEVEYHNWGDWVGNKLTGGLWNPYVTPYEWEGAMNRDDYWGDGTPKNTGDALSRAKWKKRREKMKDWFFNDGGMVPVHDEPVPTAPWRNPVEGLDDLLHEREGWRDAIYLDSLGKPTVGAGHLIADEVWEKDDPRIGTKPYSEEELHEMFAKDRDAAVNNAINNVGRDTWMQLNPAQQRAMASMAFQLGAGGQRNFANMLAAVKAGDYDEVARQALTGSEPGTQSKWLKQTPKRAFDLAEAFSPTVAAQYRNAGGAVYAEEGGGFWDWLTTDNRPEAMKGKSEQKTDAPPTFGGQDLTAAGQEPPVPDDVFPPQFRQGHPYADAVQSGIDPEGWQADPYADMGDAFVEGGDLGETGAGRTASVPPIGGAQDIPDDVYASGVPEEVVPETMGEYVPDPDGTYNPFEAEREIMARQAADQAVKDEAALADMFTEEDIISGKTKSVPPMHGGAGDINPQTEANVKNEIERQANLSAKEKAFEENPGLEAALEASGQSWQHYKSYGPTQGTRAALAEGDMQALAEEQQAAMEAEAYGGDRDAYEEAASKDREQQRQKDYIQASIDGNEDAYLQEAYGGSDPDDRVKHEKEQTRIRNEVAAAADKKARDEAKQMFSDLGLDSLFDKKELVRMAAMYAGSRILGYDHAGSLQWAAKNYVNRIDKKEAGFNQLALSGKYTPESLKQFKKTGNYTDLMAVGVSPTITGNVNVRSMNGQKVAFQEVKSGDNVLYKDPKSGTLYTAAQLENATRPYEPSFDKGTPEYRQRRDRARAQSEKAFEEVMKSEDMYRDGDNVRYNTNIKPNAAARTFWSWSESMGLDPESDEAQRILTDAYRIAIQEGKGGKYKINDLKPFLDQMYVREETGAPRLFTTNLEEADAGKAEPKYVRADKMATLGRNIDAITRDVPRWKGQDPVKARAQFYSFAMTQWDKLGPEKQKLYNKSAEKGETGFYYYVQEQLANLKSKL